MKWITRSLAATGVMAAAAFGLSAYGGSRWAAATRRQRDRLEANRRSPTLTRYSTTELEGLPAPVQRYFRAVLRDGQPIVTAVTVEHAGTFNMSQTGDRWKSFTSQQRVVTRRPGFLWDARIDAVPGMAVHVHDAYIAGEGSLRVAALGLFTLADLHGPGEMARGELMRFFAEAAWYPTALLPSQGVRWQAVDEHAANAILVDDEIGLTLLFHFDDAGLIDTIDAEARGAAVGKTIVMTPWQARLWNYQERSGMRVPLDGEAAWLPAEGRKPYWRGRIASLAHELAA